MWVSIVDAVLPLVRIVAKLRLDPKIGTRVIDEVQAKGKYRVGMTGSDKS